MGLTRVDTQLDTLGASFLFAPAQKHARPRDRDAVTAEMRWRAMELCAEEVEGSPEMFFTELLHYCISFREGKSD